MGTGSKRWSAYAGGYDLRCRAVMLALPSPVSETLVKLLTLPTERSALVLAAPRGRSR